MKNEVKWKGYTIYRWVSVFDSDDNPVDEFDSMSDAEASWYANFPSDYKFKYAAAEEINEDGDVNPAVYGDTLKEAMDKLKNVLKA